jgi:hypothetical protein
MGSSVETHVINQVFGYQLAQDYKPGPYYKNERGVKGTALETLPSRVNELGQTQSLGILKVICRDSCAAYSRAKNSAEVCVSAAGPASLDPACNAVAWRYSGFDAARDQLLL